MKIKYKDSEILNNGFELYFDQQVSGKIEKVVVHKKNIFCCFVFWIESMVAIVKELNEDNLSKISMEKVKSYIDNGVKSTKLYFFQYDIDANDFEECEKPKWFFELEDVDKIK